VRLFLFLEQWSTLETPQRLPDVCVPATDTHKQVVKQ